MKEGAWVNTRTGRVFWVREHAQFAKSKDGQIAMGLTPDTCAVIDATPWATVGPDREAICLAVMKAGFFRFRGHGNCVTCEFYGSTYENLWACYSFLQEMCGPMPHCTFNNLKTGEQIAMSYQEFSADMSDDERKVMRVAQTIFAARGAVDLTDSRHLDPEERVVLAAAFAGHTSRPFSMDSVKGSLHPKQAGFALNRLAATGHVEKVATGSYLLSDLGAIVGSALLKA